MHPILPTNLHGKRPSVTIRTLEQVVVHRNTMHLQLLPNQPHCLHRTLSLLYLQELLYRSLLQLPRPPGRSTPLSQRSGPHLTIPQRMVYGARERKEGWEDFQRRNPTNGRRLRCWGKGDPLIQALAEGHLTHRVHQILRTFLHRIRQQRGGT